MVHGIGVRQGCPLSPYLFILSVEILAEKIRTSKSIQGVIVQENEIKISQCADGTTLILDGSNRSFISALQDLGNFGTIPDLRLNNKKTEVLCVSAIPAEKKNAVPKKI